jgi:Holliday junction DNA helicase RuvA
VIAQVAGRLAAKQADRVVILTAAGVGYEIVVPLGVMERLPAAGEAVSLATELVVREDSWSLYGFSDEAERRFFQRLIAVSGVGPKIAIALMSALGVERGVRALRERNIALLASVSGIGKKTAERLALELADKLGEFEAAAAAGAGAGVGAGSAVAGGGVADAALRALERLGYASAEADRALRQALAADGGADAATLVRRALQLLTHG